MVDIFGTSTEKVGERGPPGPAGSSNLKELIKWFPELAIEQIRKNVNFSTFLVETLPPNQNWDVELNSDKRVTAWRSFNHSREGKVTLTPIGTSGVVLERLLPPLSLHQRYGLKFDGQGAYYTSEKLFLRNFINTVVLTITFSVGDASAAAEEFILNDYNPKEKKEENFRGISIVVNGEEETFDLYLHGAVAHRLKIGTALKTSWFYTVQVKWGAQIAQPDGSVRFLDSSYAIYVNVDEEVTCLAENAFHTPRVGKEQKLALSIGGKKTVRSADGYFTGVVSNVEILQTAYETIPKELLYFIATKQTLINDDW